MSKQSTKSEGNLTITTLFRNMEEDEDQTDSSSASTEDISLLEKNDNKRLSDTKGRLILTNADLCINEISPSISSVVTHPYYPYPPITDPGIESALFLPYFTVQYSEDGQEIYKAACEEFNTHVISLFYENLPNDVIDLSYYGVASAGVHAMSLALQNNPHVKHFDLTENFLDDDACLHLGVMLKSNKHLEELNLTACRIGVTGLVRLIKYLHLNRHLTNLNLARNCLGDEGGVALAHQMCLCTNFKCLNLSNNKLGPLTADALYESFQYNHDLTHLDLSWNLFFHTSTTVKLFEQLALSSTLMKLNLAWNALEGKHVAKAVSYVIIIPTLRSFDLSNNRFNDKDIEIIVQFIDQAKSLKTLNLSFNPVSPVGSYIVLNKMLLKGIKLKELNLDKICVSKEFMKTLKHIRLMKKHKNFVVTHGEVLENWTISGSDPRELVLQRAAYLGQISKHQVDVPLYFLKLNEEHSAPVTVQELSQRMKDDKLSLDEDLIKEFADVFPGSKFSKTATINLKSVSEYIHRLQASKKFTHVLKNKMSTSKTHIKR